jgi:hypothetical protein
MSETDLMRVFGWRSSEMPKRYGSSVADVRTREAKRRLGPGGERPELALGFLDLFVYP